MEKFDLTKYKTAAYENVDFWKLLALKCFPILWTYESKEFWKLFPTILVRITDLKHFWIMFSHSNDTDFFCR